MKYEYQRNKTFKINQSYIPKEQNEKNKEEIYTGLRNPSPPPTPKKKKKKKMNRRKMQIGEKSNNDSNRSNSRSSDIISKNKNIGDKTTTTATIINK